MIYDGRSGVFRCYCAERRERESVGWGGQVEGCESLTRQSRKRPGPSVELLWEYQKPSFWGFEKMEVKPASSCVMVAEVGYGGSDPTAPAIVYTDLSW